MPSGNTSWLGAPVYCRKPCTHTRTHFHTLIHAIGAIYGTGIRHKRPERNPCKHEKYAKLHTGPCEMATLPAVQPCHPCMDNNKALMTSIENYWEVALENDFKQYERECPSVIILVEMNYTYLFS